MHVTFMPTAAQLLQVSYFTGTKNIKASPTKKIHFRGRFLEEDFNALTYGI